MALQDLPNTSSIGPTDDLASNFGVSVFTQYIICWPIDDLASNSGVAGFTQYIVYQPIADLASNLAWPCWVYPIHRLSVQQTRFGEQLWGVCIYQYIVYGKSLSKQVTCFNHVMFNNIKKRQNLTPPSAHNLPEHATALSSPQGRCP